MLRGLMGLACLAAAMSTADAAQSNWSIKGAPGASGFALVATVKPPVSYIFDCSSKTHVAVTHTAATRLTDAAKRRPVPDNWTGPLPSGAAFMALRLDKNPLVMNEAIAARNDKGGWDLTIDLPKDDPAFLALPEAEKVTLMTTGQPTALELSDEDRAVIAEFIRGCTAN